MNILVVEPSSSFRSLIREILSEVDTHVIELESGADAIKFLFKQCPDIICVSHELGDIDSFEFISTIQKKNLCNEVPKFLITSNETLEFRRKCYDIGYTEILQKKDISTLQTSLTRLVLNKVYQVSANILYVEDVASTAAYTSKLMQNAGWEVDYVDSAENALEKMQQNEYDLLVTDLILAGKKSGINLIEELRAGDEKMRNQPILALSGWNDVLRQVYVLQRGASDFIAKPFQENDFLARALNLIHNKRKREETLKAQRALSHKAFTDKLTGLCNRHGIDEYCQGIREDNAPLSMLLLDIDHFKLVNDKHGHERGDKVINLIAEAIHKHTRATDMAARWGGEEFVILMPRCDIATACERAESFRSLIEQLQPDGIHTTVSVGVAGMHEYSPDLFETLFNHADKGLLQAKRAGRNCVVLYD